VKSQISGQMSCNPQEMYMVLHPTNLVQVSMRLCSELVSLVFAHGWVCGHWGGLESTVESGVTAELEMSHGICCLNTVSHVA